ncbi:MAG: hypothetical protein M3P39_00005, partial [Actinomycetota bacterium]|nr:hypothetical protein [Actinomycetota bacterium]
MTADTLERPAARAAEIALAPPRRRLALARLVAPAALAGVTAWLAFEAGGFFPGTVGLVAVALGIGLVLWATLAPRPLAGASVGLALLAAGLTGLAAWTLVSASWSGAPGRAVLEFDRVLLYLLAALTFGLATPALGGPRRLLWGLATAATGVCTCALVTRLLPELWRVDPGRQPERLSFPVTYWNTLGVLAALGAIACVHLAASVREPRLARVLGAAALPVLGTALLLTFSRGAIVALALGLPAYLLLARPRGVVAAALAAGPATAFALVAGYGAEALDTPASPAALAQGRELAVTVGACVVVAAALRVAALPLD